MKPAMRIPYNDIRANRSTSVFLPCVTSLPSSPTLVLSDGPNVGDDISSGFNSNNHQYPYHNKEAHLVKLVRIYATVREYCRVREFGYAVWVAVSRIIYTHGPPRSLYILFLAFLVVSNES